MNKAATWTINGVGFDAREAARDAAQRQGKSLGEWLQGVIADHAAERGVDEADVDDQDRIDAVTERLERLEASGVSSRTASRGDRPAARADRSRFSYGTEEDDDFEIVSGRSRSRDGVRERYRQPARPTRDAEATEALLDEAIEAMERRTLRSERKTDKALAQFARMLESRETKRDDEHDMVSVLTRKLSDMEARFADRAVSENPIKTALARLEERLETMGRRAPDPAASAARPIVPSQAPAEPAKPADDEPIRRLEAKLNSILDAVVTKPGAAAMQTSALATAQARLAEPAITPPAFANRRLGEAVAEIANRQRALDGDVNARRRPEPQRLAMPSRRAYGPDASELQGEIASLTAKIEDMRRDLAGTIGSSRAGRDASAQMDGLRAEIATLSRAMREMSPRAPLAEVSSALDDMRRDFTRRDEAKLAAVASRADVQDLKAELGGISKTLSQLAPRGSVTALEEAIRALTVRMETSRVDQARETLMRPLDDVIGDLRHSLADIDARDAIGGMEREARTIERKLKDINGVDASVLGRIQHQTEEIRDLLSSAAAHPLAVERIEQQVASLAQKFDQQPGRDSLNGQTVREAADEIRALVENQPGMALFDKIDRRLMDLTAKIDQAVEAASGARKIAEQSKRRFDDVQEQLAAQLTARSADAAISDTHSLERLVRDLSERIEAVRAPESDTHAIEALQDQIVQLSRRFERTDSELSSLSAIERSMHELFAHLEETRASVETAAARAARDAAQAVLVQSPSDPTALREIASLKAIQEDADHRTHRTLNAVHETLERVVDRLSQMESEVATVRAPRSDSASLDGAGRRSERAASGPRAETLPDLMLDPADALERPITSRPAVDRARSPSFAPSRAAADLDETAGRADFIAAARRAARTAQNDPSVLAIKSGDAPRAASEVRAGLMAKTRDYVASHKKPVLLSIAALFVLLGTIAVMGSLKGDDGATQLAAGPAAVARPVKLAEAAPRQDVSRQDMPRAQATAGRAITADLTPSALPKAPPPINAALAGSDPITTGSINRLPSFAAQAAASAAPLAPSGALRQMAEDGDAAAQYEVGSRYAEGRLLAKDFKLAAQWYEKAAQQGLAPAQYKLAALYEKGLGVTKDKVKARYWYIKAADAGNPRAMHNLAVLVADGDGKPDYASAVIWFRKAAEYGIHDSQYNLAILLARGLGTQQSLVQSYQWFAVAAQQNDADAATKRDEVGSKLNAADLSVAKTLASTFRPKNANVAAVQVDPPSGGWDGASPLAPVKSAGAKLSSL